MEFAKGMYGFVKCRKLGRGIEWDEDEEGI